MEDFSKYDIDDLFRQGSEQSEFVYREDAWEQMDSMLEKKRKRRFIFWLFSSGLLVVALTSLWFYYPNNKQKTDSFEINFANNEIVEIIEKPEFKERQSNTRIDSESTESTTISQSISNNTKTESKITKKTSSKKGITALSNLDVINEEIKIIKEKTKSNLPFILSSNNNKEVTNQTILETANTNKSGNNQAVALIDRLNLLQSVSSIFLEEKNENLEDYTLTRNLLANELNYNKNSNSFSFFSAGILAAPEYNTLAINEKAELGYRFGLRADYYFAKHFSVGLGLTFSRKTYTADASLYNAKAGFWTDGIAPIEVSSQNRVTEIPLEVKYYFNHYNQNGFFLGAGLNSYRMNLEDYQFGYDQLVPNAITTWQEKGTNSHYFGIGTLSAGYQTLINDHFRIQVSPYAQIPLTGIGQGKVNLQSAGLQILVNISTKK